MCGPAGKRTCNNEELKSNCTTILIYLYILHNFIIIYVISVVLVLIQKLHVHVLTNYTIYIANSKTATCTCMCARSVNELQVLVRMDDVIICLALQGCKATY